MIMSKCSYFNTKEQESQISNWNLRLQRGERTRVVIVMADLFPAGNQLSTALLDLAFCVAEYFTLLVHHTTRDPGA